MFNLHRLNSKGLNVVNEEIITLDNSLWDNDVMNHSFFVEACQFCESIDRYVYESNTRFYRSICESGGNEIMIHESFGDWWDTFKKIIKKIVDFLHALVNKFLVGINMLISREKFIKDHEKDLSKFNENHKFNMSIFTFTLDKAIPPATAIYDSTKLSEVDYLGTGKVDHQTNSTNFSNFLKANYEKHDSAPTSLKDGKEAGTIAKELEASYDKFRDETGDGTFYDKVRGLLLDLPAGTTVQSVDFSKELFEVFRDGQSGKEDHEFDSGDINDALSRFKRYKDVKKIIDKQRKEAEKEYKRVEKDIEKLVDKAKEGKITLRGDLGDGFTKDVEIQTGSIEIANKMETFVKAIANVVHEVGNLHSIAFGAKLDAYKDCFKQDKQILYSALYRILGNISTGKRKYSEE